MECLPSFDLYTSGFSFFGNSSTPFYSQYSFKKLKERVNGVVGISWSSIVIRSDLNKCISFGDHVDWEKEAINPEHVETNDTSISCISKGSIYRYINSIWTRCNYDQEVKHFDMLNEDIVAILKDGSIWKGEVPMPIKVKVEWVSCGKEHAVILTECHQIYTFGGGSRGQLGIGIVKLQQDPIHLEIMGGLDVVKVCAGGWHSCCLTSLGDLYCWGWNQSGQLGFPTKDQSLHGVNIQSEPRLFEMFDLEESVVDIACGSRHTLALLDTGELWSWGWDEYGQLGRKKGTGSPAPVILDGSPIISSIYCGPWTSYILIGSK